MGKLEKLRKRILSGTSDNSISFEMLCGLLKHFKFVERVKGDHHIFAKSGVSEIINLQPLGSKAKPYQVKQVRNIIIKYRLGDQDVE